MQGKKTGKGSRRLTIARAGLAKARRALASVQLEDLDDQAEVVTIAARISNLLNKTKINEVEQSK